MTVTEPSAWGWTVTQLREELQKLEAEGKGGLLVADYEHTGLDKIEIAETTFRGYGIEPPFVVLTCK